MRFYLPLRKSVFQSLLGLGLACGASSEALDESASDLAAGRIGIGATPPRRPTPGAAPWETMRVVGGDLYDRCGEPLLLRGVNKDVVALDRTGASFQEIAKTGANAVRLVWLTSVPPSDIDTALSRAVEHGLAPIWEMHDSTGTFAKLDAVVTYWKRPDTVAMIRKYERDLIVNIANEAGGLGISDDVFVATYSAAIADLRALGVHTPLMIDATQWGQNVEQLLRTGKRLLDADPDLNLLFSWHEYSSSPLEGARITASLEAAKTAHLPLLIGEFAGIAPDACDTAVPYAHVLGETLRLGIGWLAWSWDNTNGSCRRDGRSGFDMVDDGMHYDKLRDGWPRDVVRDHIGSLAYTSKRTSWQTRRVCESFGPPPDRPIRD